MAEENAKKPRAPRIQDDQIIRLRNDSEGTKYSADHNPKRKGTKAHTRFAAYRDGMTVAEAVAAGNDISDISHDRRHGFIDLEPSVTEATPEAAAA